MHQGEGWRVTSEIDMLSYQVTKEVFNETSLEQRVSYKDFGAVQAKKIVKICIFRLYRNPEITSFIFLLGTGQGLINLFSTLCVVSGSILK